VSIPSRIDEQNAEWGRFLLRRVLRYHPFDAEGGSPMWRNTLWKWWEQYSGYIIGPILFILALAVSRFVRPYYSTHFLDDLVVALVIAAILTMTVDPFVKQRLYREATRDIFHHMLGFSLPAVIRERLQNTVETTKIYRQNFTEHIVISEDGESVVFDTEVEFEVLNPTPHDFGFLPLLQFEKSERPVLKSLTCFGSANCGKDARLVPTSGGRGFECKGAEITIPAGGSKRFKYEYSVRYPTALGFYFPDFKYPTIGLGLTIKAPSNLNVKATPAEYEADGEWRYPNRLFMPGERFGITWETID
jgi:hypothetical protein